jgi:hypothetical protein
MSTLRTSSVAAKENSRSWISGGTNTTMRLRGSRRMLNTSLTTCARRRTRADAADALAGAGMGQCSRFLRVARRASANSTTPITAIASRSGTNTAHWSPTRNTVLSEDTK